jgi:hypothetical protein
VHQELPIDHDQLASFDEAPFSKLGRTTSQMDTAPEEVIPLTTGDDRPHGSAVSTSTASELPNSVVEVNLAENNKVNDTEEEHPVSLTEDDTTYATPSAHVAAFVKATIKKVVPKACWGDGDEGSYNQSVILEAVVEFIVRRKFESMTLHDVLQKLKVGGLLFSISLRTNLKSRSPLFLG